MGVSFVLSLTVGGKVIEERFLRSILVVRFAMMLGDDEIPNQVQQVGLNLSGIRRGIRVLKGDSCL